MTTDERLGKLEGQLARVRLFNRCLIACIILGLGVWFVCKSFGSESGAKEIRANWFVLEDENGKERASLMMVDGTPHLLLCDESGNLTVMLSGFQSYPGLSLFDENVHETIELFGEKGVRSLRMFDENGKSRVELGVFKGAPNLLMYDENGETIWKAP